MSVSIKQLKAYVAVVEENSFSLDKNLSKNLSWNLFANLSNKELQDYLKEKTQLDGRGWSNAQKYKYVVAC